ncbi:MAG: VWA domain-containing protein [Bacillota bacterium]|nr:VWA domain-containing protein [Bacillota bacterium]
MGIKKGGGSLLVLLLLISSVILLLPGVSKAANDSNISITQVESKLPNLTLFVRLDNVGVNSAKIKENLSIKINDTPTQITDLQPVKSESGVTENTAYLVLVDTSVSMESQNRVPQLQTLLDQLLGYVGTNDKIAVFGVSNKLETIKDFGVTDTAEGVTKTIRNSISSGAGTGTYLYSGIRDAVEKGRTAKDVPERRIVVLITDGGVDGDSFSSDDIKKYVDVDRLPVYTLILNKQSSVEQEFKNAADQIAQKTGGQSFISTNGNELFAQFKSSIEKCIVIKLRCNAFKAFNLQAVMNVALKDDQGEIRQAAKFIALPSPIDKEQLGKEVVEDKDGLKTSYFGAAVIMIPIILLILVIILALVWLSKNKGRQQKGKETNPKSGEMKLQTSQGFSGKIGLEMVQGVNKGEVMEIQPDQNPRIGSTPECAVKVGFGNKIVGSISAIDEMIVIHSQSPGEIFVNGIVIQGSHILQNGDLVRVPEMMFRVVM